MRLGLRLECLSHPAGSQLPCPKEEVWAGLARFTDCIPQMDRRSESQERPPSHLGRMHAGPGRTGLGPGGGTALLTHPHLPESLPA